MLFVYHYILDRESKLGFNMFRSKQLFMYIYYWLYLLLAIIVASFFNVNTPSIGLLELLNYTHIIMYAEHFVPMIMRSLSHRNMLFSGILH